MKKVNMGRGKILALVTLLLFGLAGLAEAQIAMGRVSARTGFPSFIRDGATGLVICLDGIGFCEPDPVAPAIPQSVASGFGRIAPYYRVAARVLPAAPTNPDIRVEMSVLATYAGVLADGNQLVQNQLFVDLSGMPVPGTYILRHPWGQKNILVDLTGRARKTFAGKGRPADNFQGAAAGPVKSFLKANPAPANGQHIGVLFKLQTLTGSPLRNFVELEAPAGADIGGRTQPNIVRISQFTVEGKVR